jgi:hypothetical protein
VIHSVSNPLARTTGAIHVYGGDFFGIGRSEWASEDAPEQPFDVQRALQRFDRGDDVKRSAVAAARHADLTTLAVWQPAHETVVHQVRRRKELAIWASSSGPGAFNAEDTHGVLSAMSRRSVVTAFGIATESTPPPPLPRSASIRFVMTGDANPVGEEGHRDGVDAVSNPRDPY